MKYIEKQLEPDQFQQWKQGESPDWLPSWGALDDAPDIKKALKNSLIIEQGAICCYCGIRINHNNSHIEHIKPKRRYPEDALIYNNLLASCLSDQKKRAHLHCGMRKGDWYVASQFVSPLDPLCQQRFRFISDGTIMPGNPKDDNAVVTIQRLGLDCSRLNAHRKKAIEASGLFDDSLTEYDLEIWAEAVMQQNDQGNFVEFCFVVSSVLKGSTSRMKNG